MRNSNENSKYRIALRIFMILLLLLFSLIVICLWEDMFPNNSPYRKDYDLDYYKYNDYDIPSQVDRFDRFIEP